jgi:hypothetical protein
MRWDGRLAVTGVVAMREINIKLWRNDELMDWSMEINRRFHEQVSDEGLTDLVEGEPERLSALIYRVLGAKFLLAVFCIGGAQKWVQPGFRATRPLDEFNFYFADATPFLMGKYALGRLVPRFQRSQFKVKPVKLLRSRSHWFVVKREFKLPHMRSADSYRRSKFRNSAQGNKILIHSWIRRTSETASDKLRQPFSVEKHRISGPCRMGYTKQNHLCVASIILDAP